MISALHGIEDKRPNKQRRTIMTRRGRIIDRVMYWELKHARYLNWSERWAIVEALFYDRALLLR